MLRGLFTVVLATGLPFTTCINPPDGGQVCTTLFAYGVNVLVTEADTGAPINNAVLTLTDGDYSEVMQLIPTGYYVGAGERPGTYTLTIDVPGVANTTVPNLVVGFDGCHVIGVSLDAKVRPGQIDVTPNSPA